MERKRAPTKIFKKKPKNSDKEVSLKTATSGWLMEFRHKNISVAQKFSANPLQQIILGFQPTSKTTRYWEGFIQVAELDFFIRWEHSLWNPRIYRSQTFRWFYSMYLENSTPPITLLILEVDEKRSDFLFQAYFHFPTITFSGPDWPPHKNLRHATLLLNSAGKLSISSYFGYSIYDSFYVLILFFTFSSIHISFFYIFYLPILVKAESFFLNGNFWIVLLLSIALFPLGIIFLTNRQTVYNGCISNYILFNNFME